MGTKLTFEMDTFINYHIDRHNFYTEDQFKNLFPQEFGELLVGDLMEKYGGPNKDWNKVCEASGLDLSNYKYEDLKHWKDIEKLPKPIDFTHAKVKELLLKPLQLFVDKKHVYPTFRSAKESEQFPNMEYICETFGSYTNACHQVEGANYTKKYDSSEREYLLNYYHIKYGHGYHDGMPQYTWDEIAEEHNIPCASEYKKAISTQATRGDKHVNNKWAKVLKECNRSFSNLGRKTRIDDLKDVRYTIGRCTKACVESGKPLTYQEFKKFYEQRNGYLPASLGKMAQTYGKSYEQAILKPTMNRIQESPVFLDRYNNSAKIHGYPSLPSKVQLNQPIVTATIATLEKLAASIPAVNSIHNVYESIESLNQQQTLDIDLERSI